MQTHTFLVFAHVGALLLWIGSIVATGLLLGARAGEARVRGELAHGLYRKLATPGFLVAFVAGTTLLLDNPRHYLVEHHWMHGKLTAVVAIIGLHHVIGAKARKAAEGIADGAGAAPLAWVTLALALVAVAAVILGPAVM